MEVAFKLQTQAFIVESAFKGAFVTQKFYILGHTPNFAGHVAHPCVSF